MDEGAKNLRRSYDIGEEANTSALAICPISYVTTLAK